MKLKISIGINAIRAAFPTNGSLALFNSNSKEPSNTIRINPTVPKKGNIGDKFGSSISKYLQQNLTENPNINNNITEGILVFDELMSNRYAINSSMQITINNGVVIIYFLSIILIANPPPGALVNSILESLVIICFDIVYACGLVLKCASFASA